MLDDSKKEGKLISADENEIMIGEKNPKAKKPHPNNKTTDNKNRSTSILINQIRHTVVLVTF